jgi:hypothetical protein
LVCAAGAADAPPKRLLVSAAGAAGAAEAPKMLFVSADSGAGVEAAEPKREPPDLVSLAPKANFFEAGSSVLVAAGAAPKRLPVVLAAPVENREEAGFSAGVSVVEALPNRLPNWGCAGGVASGLLWLPKADVPNMLVFGASDAAAAGCAPNKDGAAAGAGLESLTSSLSFC